MRLAIQVVLAIAIVVLAYLLFQSIRTPWTEYEGRLAREAAGRERMDDVRTALIEFRNVNNAYPPSLDSLVFFVKNDTAFVLPERDDDDPRIGEFTPDSLTVSARGGAPFNYERVTSDTTSIEIYWLQDPGAPEDSIGSRAQPPNPALRNAASWLE